MGYDDNRPSEDDLAGFVAGVTDEALQRIEEKLPHGFVRLKVAEAERRQAQHDIRSVEDIVVELARNSRDAGAKTVMVGFQKEQGRYRRITVVDDGCGIPGEMHRLIFEPRVTSKSADFNIDRYGVHGRGMALFSIESRAEYIRVQSSDTGSGAAITLLVNTGSVLERSDQASIPKLEGIGGNVVVGVGPHNVNRVLLEMSVDHQEMDFYLGTFAEVVATMRFISRERGKGEEFLWGGIWKETDAKRLMDKAVSMGLPVSERNAYRVLSGEISPLETVYSMAAKKSTPSIDNSKQQAAEAPASAKRKRNPLRRIKTDDLNEIGEVAGKVAGGVLGRYYLRAAETHVRRGRGRIIVSIYVDGEDGDV